MRPCHRLTIRDFPVRPSCSAAFGPGAVLCVNCGYNLKTGKKLSAVVVETDGDDDADADVEDDAAEAEERAWR